MRFYRRREPGAKAEARAVAGESSASAPTRSAWSATSPRPPRPCCRRCATRPAGPRGRGGAQRAGLRVGEAVGGALVRADGATYQVVSFALDADEGAGRAGLPSGVRRDRRARRHRRLVITDRITSPTGSLLPAAAIAAAARAAGALTFVDAAHVPGHVEARPAASGADFWTGTWHKWGFAPRGAERAVGGRGRAASGVVPADHELEPPDAVPAAVRHLRHRRLHVLVLPGRRGRTSGATPAGWSWRHGRAPARRRCRRGRRRGPADRLPRATVRLPSRAVALPAAGAPARRRRRRPRTSTR